MFRAALREHGWEDSVLLHYFTKEDVQQLGIAAREAEAFQRALDVARQKSSAPSLPIEFQDLKSWLAELGLQMYNDRLEFFCCKAVDLEQMSDNRLEEMGVLKPGHRKLLLAACKVLKTARHDGIDAERKRLFPPSGSCSWHFVCVCWYFSVVLF